MKYCTLSGFIGALVTILVLLVIFIFCEPFNYKPLYIINPNIAVCQNDSIIANNLSCNQIEALKDLESKGLLLTPHEYTSHISSFYATLVAFLIGLFVLFTVGSIYSIKITSKKEIDEARKDLDARERKIKEELKNDIKNCLSDLMNDSISFKEFVIDSIYGRVEDDLVTKDEIERIDNEVEQINKDVNKEIETLKNDMGALLDSMSELTETISSNEEIQ